MPNQRSYNMIIFLLLVSVGIQLAEMFIGSKKVQPAHVFQKVGETGLDLKTKIDDLTEEMHAVRATVDARNAWTEETTKKVIEINAELSDRGKWMESVKDYIKQATADRWRKADTKNHWEEVYKRNPGLKRVEIE